MRLLAGVAAALVAGTQASSEWEAFKAAHGKAYANAGEERLRKQVFEANMVRARELNKQEPLAKFGATPYSDLTPAEFSAYRGLAPGLASRKSLRPSETFTAAQVGVAQNVSVDWREKGAVTAVKDQKSCGSCWAFSTTGNVEGQWFLAGNKLVELSEQQLVSCDKVSDSCIGGFPSDAIEYLVSAGAETEEDYPYTAGIVSLKKCKYNASKVAARVTGSVELPKDEGQMLAWMQKNGPVSISIVDDRWQSYKGGIMTKCIIQEPGTSPNHAVLVVGNGYESGVPYWIVKNSWGAKWGEDGYIRLAYGTDQCGITLAPISAVVGK